MHEQSFDRQVSHLQLISQYVQQVRYFSDTLKFWRILQDHSARAQKVADLNWPYLSFHFGQIPDLGLEKPYDYISSSRSKYEIMYCNPKLILN